MANTDDDPFFRALDIPAAEFTKAHLSNLLSGRCSALMVREFTPQAECRTTAERILDPEFPMTWYDHERVNPPIARFGPVISDYRNGPQLLPEYWDEARAAQEVWETTMRETDLKDGSIARLQKVWDDPVLPATVGGNPLFLGSIREINGGALIHFDDVRREFGGDLFDSGCPVVQLAFNTWVSVPSAGGTTTVWRRRWEPSDEPCRSGYGYDRSVVGTCPSFDLTAGLGDALIFDPRNYHAVAPSEEGRRIAVTFFLALSFTGGLVAWS